MSNNKQNKDIYQYVTKKYTNNKIRKIFWSRGF